MAIAYADERAGKGGLKNIIMQAKSANFLTVLKGPKQFVIPIYQRTYSWQIAQCNKLFNDILLQVMEQGDVVELTNELVNRIILHKEKQ